MRVLELLAVSSLLLVACDSRPRSLEPMGTVTVYSDANCQSIVGATSQSLKVDGLIYPDKTDYVVQVSFQGQPGYVCSDNFELK